LTVEILAFDSATAPRASRPFIAGEKVFIALSIRGGEGPFDAQIFTKSGDPRLASSSTTFESEPSTETAAGLEFPLGAEVPSGDYVLAIRISDHNGLSAIAKSAPFAVLGSNAPQPPREDNALQLKIVDVAGRARPQFYQGEAIEVRATLPSAEDWAIAIVAEDDRQFVPKQHYKGGDTEIFLPLQVPRLARVGRYRVDIATRDGQASVPLNIVGTEFPAAEKPIVTALHLYGGPKQRIPQEGIFDRGVPVRVEAIVGGVSQRASARLRLRTSIGKQVDLLEFPRIEPADTAPTARSLISSFWTPSPTLTAGRHTLEIEVQEADNVSTIFREILIR